MWYKKSLLLIVFVFINFVLISKTYAADKNFCEAYAKEAQKAVNDNKQYQCGFTGLRWSEDIEGQKQWCLVTRKEIAKKETQVRAKKLNECQIYHTRNLDSMVEKNNMINKCITEEMLSKKEKINESYNCLINENMGIQVDVDNNKSIDILYLLERDNRNYILITLLLKSKSIEVVTNTIFLKNKFLCNIFGTPGSLYIEIFDGNGVTISNSCYEEYPDGTHQNSKKISLKFIDDKWLPIIIKGEEHEYSINGHSHNKSYSFNWKSKRFITKTLDRDDGDGRTSGFISKTIEYGYLKDTPKILLIEKILSLKFSELSSLGTVNPIFDSCRASYPEKKPSNEANCLWHPSY